MADEFPIRQDTAGPESMKLNWKIHELKGYPVFRFSDAEAVAQTPVKERRQFAITNLHDIKEGDEIIVRTFTGWCVASVTSVNYEANEAHSVSGGLHLPLDFGGDIQHAWTNHMSYSDSALKLIDFGDEKDEPEEEHSSIMRKATFKFLDI